jgi:hypothetical protein
MVEISNSVYTFQYFGTIHEGERQKLREWNEGRGYVLLI